MISQEIAAALDRLIALHADPPTRAELRDSPAYGAGYEAGFADGEHEGRLQPSKEAQ